MTASVDSWLDALDIATRGRLGRAGLLVERLHASPALSTPLSDSTCMTVADATASPIEQAWTLAEAFAHAVDRSLGRHCTPRSVALHLARAAMESGLPTYIADPAVGGGALLLAAAQVIQQDRGRVDYDAFVGCDVDPLAVAVSQLALWLAAGQPSQAVGQFALRDFLLEGMPDPVDRTSSLILANPPWGTLLLAEALQAFKTRVGRPLADLLKGTPNIATCFLIEAVLRTSCNTALITPFDWVYHQSGIALRRALRDSRRLSQLFVLRKHVFPAAPDMIPTLSVWRASAHSAPITISRCGFAAPIPLPHPLPIEELRQVSASEWDEMPLAILPVLRSRRFVAVGRRFCRQQPRMGDPDLPAGLRLLHIGDGTYKTRVMPFLSFSGSGTPILTRACQTGRYRHDAPAAILTEAGVSLLSRAEMVRFSSTKIILHALKKASAPWRLSATLHSADDGPLVLTNNFIVASSRRYTGDLHYPLALLNTRLFNRMYGEHFPGVNIEAYTLGLLPLPWPPMEGHQPLPPIDRIDLEPWLVWSRNACCTPGTVPVAVYERICSLARQLDRTLFASARGTPFPPAPPPTGHEPHETTAGDTGTERVLGDRWASCCPGSMLPDLLSVGLEPLTEVAIAHRLDHRIEALVAGLFGLDVTDLQALIDDAPDWEVAR